MSDIDALMSDFFEVWSDGNWEAAGSIMKNVLSKPADTCTDDELSRIKYALIQDPFHRLGCAQESIPYLMRMIRPLAGDRETESLLYVIGNAYQICEIFDEAKRIFTLLVNVYPPHPQSYYNLGNAYSGLGEWEKAVKCYMAALGIDPTYLIAIDAMADELLNAGKPELALRLLDNHEAILVMKGHAALTPKIVEKIRKIDPAAAAKFDCM